MNIYKYIYLYICDMNVYICVYTHLFIRPIYDQVRKRRADIEARAKETDELRAVVSSLRDQRTKGNAAHAEELEVKERQMQVILSPKPHTLHLP